MSNDNAKKKALELAVSHIEKQFGEGSIMMLGKHSSNRDQRDQNGRICP